MNERVRTLRENSQNAVPTISMERALLVDDVYRRHQGEVPVPILRALAFQHLMENKALWIGEGELIVGERGEAPAATPTFPELCCHTLEDFRIMDARERISFRADEEARRLQAERIIPFWEKRSMRAKILAAMTPEWKECYHAGLFTEFMEQRGPGHTVCDDKIYRKGFSGFKTDIEEQLAALDFYNDPEALDKKAQLEAMAICCDALITLAQRYADLAEKMAESSSDPARQEELYEIAAICRWVPGNAPRTFHEALQMYWFVHIGVITEMNNWDAFNPGRLDQHLSPFYEQERAAGTLTVEEAKELLGCFWIKFNNQPAPPKVGVTLKESGTYTDFANINLGGLTPEGEDGVNEVTFLLLDVIDEMRLLQPSSNVQVSRKSPPAFVKRACEISRKGWGQPSFFNADAVVEELLRMGKSLEDARCGGTSGCVETGAFGKEAYILTGYFNLPKILEITLHDGRDPRTGKQLGPRTGDPRHFADFDTFFAAFRMQLQHFADIKIRGNNVIEVLYAREMPVPFLSVVTEDCIRNGKDYNAGGARYNTSYVQGVGIGSMADSLAVLKKQVFEDQTVTIDRLLEAMAKDFEGETVIHNLVTHHTPKYGNDDDYADGLMQKAFEAFYRAINGRPNMKGGCYRINMLPTTCHVYFGSVIGALPDGRKAGLPLPEGISPCKGADRQGPTAVVKSASKMDHLNTGGTLLNQKFTPQVLAGEQGLDNLAHLVRGYFQLDGHHIQFNVIDRKTLRAAQDHPEDYPNLIVRVAGYSDYFNNLDRALQDEIIARTEQRFG
jgi:pyruvate formate-lyase/glycerol dehydratase family glycyl radical enzyme